MPNTAEERSEAPVFISIGLVFLGVGVFTLAHVVGKLIARVDALDERVFACEAASLALAASQVIGYRKVTDLLERKSSEGPPGK